jgi:hypothetical protein
VRLNARTLNSTDRQPDTLAARRGGARRAWVFVLVICQAVPDT